MTINLFPFLNEFDILEIRLRELADVVDLFVICEGDLTFTGNKKPYHLDSEWQRFAPWHHKIRRHKIKMPANADKVKRDYHHKNAMIEAIPDAKADDVLIWADVDEIPRATVVASYKPGDGIKALGMPTYRFYFNVRAGDADCIEWVRPKILTVGEARRTNFQRARDDGSFPVIHDAGWHFTSCGGAAMLRYKLDSFVHSDCPHNQPMTDGIADGSWVNGGGFGYGLKSTGGGLHSVVGIDDTFPRFVRENIPLMDSWGMIYKGKR